MRLPGYLIVFALGILLAATTPVGTGAGVHQFDLLHPLFSHVHLVNGRIMTHEELAPEADAQPTRPGVNLGADKGASATDAGIGVSPTLPIGAGLRAAWPSAAIALDEHLLPRGRTDAPPDPPPL